MILVTETERRIILEYRKRADYSRRMVRDMFGRCVRLYEARGAPPPSEPVEPMELDELERGVVWSFRGTTDYGRLLFFEIFFPRLHGEPWPVLNGKRLKSAGAWSWPVPDLEYKPNETDGGQDDGNKE